MATLFKGFSTVDKVRAPYTLTDIELVKQDLLNEFYTKKGERVMRPNFGCVVHDMLMNPEDLFTEEEIRDDILRIVEKEPRVNFLDMNVYSLDQTIRIELFLSFVLLESEEVLYLNFTREN